jgi:dTMP kinase
VYGAVVARGRLITIEGIDGAGKTTLAQSLLHELRSRGIDIELLREPGGVEIAERIRSLVSDPRMGVTPQAEALLYAAARAQLVHELLAPRLDAGGWVLLDRFVDSSLAYQGAGRGLGIENVAAMNQLATAGVKPDRTLLLDIEPQLARERQHVRAVRPDRLEQEDGDFFATVAEGYREVARREPERVRVLDATADPQSVLDAALAALSDLL